MNILRYSIITLFLVITGIQHSRCQNLEDKGIQVLTDFYTTYAPIMRVVKNLPKLDSLQKLYCTIRFRAELKREFKNNGLDHDLLTNDYGIDIKALKTFSISSNSKQRNTYIVTYTINTISPSNQPTQQKVILKVLLINENGALKISSVK